jgi:hypothetical protein
MTDAPSPSAGGAREAIARAKLRDRIERLISSWRVFDTDDAADEILALTSPAPITEDASDLIQACADQFREYERQHRAKGTPEGDAKAEVDAEFARRCLAMLGARSARLPAKETEGWQDIASAPFRRDGRPSKYDLCAHEMPLWQDCAQCISEFARAAIARRQPAE